MTAPFYKILFISFMVIIYSLSFVTAAMTEKQMKSAGKLIRNSCQPKTKATDEQIDAMHKGIWNEEPEEKCYMQCVLVMMKVMKKNGNPDWESAYAQADALPEARVAPTKASMEHCEKNVVIKGDKCDDAWRMAKCIYFDNPDNYILP